MNLRLEKKMRIISELVSFCHNQGAVEYSMRLAEVGPRESTIMVAARMEQIEPSALEYLIDMLNLPRSREVEQAYWELTGDTESSDDLTLIGQMVDSAVVTHENGVLVIEAVRID